MTPMTTPTYEILDVHYVLTSEGLVNIDTSAVMSIEDGIKEGILRLVTDEKPKISTSMADAVEALNKLPVDKMESLVIGTIYRQGPSDERFIMIDLVGMNQDVANTAQEILAEVQRKQHGVRRPLH